MRRREFIALAGGAAAWPLSVSAQQSDPLRRVAGLMSTSASDTEEQAGLAAFVERLRELGWKEGRNLRLDIRWGAADDERNGQYAAELVALAPEVIFANTAQTVSALQMVTRTIPIVLAGVVDPLGAGFVESLARPGGNTTGLSAFEYTIAGKWLELLKEIAPHVLRVAVMRDPTTPTGIGQFGAIQAVAPIGMELGVIAVHGDFDKIERA
jgi:putative ABC transport system substrate-binding protein